MSFSEANRKQLYRVADAMVILSMSRTAIYEQIGSGRLRSVTEGRSRLIPASHFLSRKRMPPAANSQKPW
jgi:hypothetical protein